MRISINWIVSVLFILTVFGSFSVKDPVAAKKKFSNIILIVTDDHGYGDVGFNGCKDIPTPNIDKIAANGVVFPQGYVTYAVCAPSRAGMLTGRYQDRFGYSRNPLYRPFDSIQGLSLQEQLLPAFLKPFGYATMAIGKWHLGAHSAYKPMNRGFDQFFGFSGGGHRYFPEEFDIELEESATNEAQSYRTKLTMNEKVVDETDYLTDAFSREAVSFVRRHKDQPFFLYLAYNAPHNPLQAPKKYLDRFPAIQNQKRKTYAAMVSAVDDGVGRILATLDELKITDNTLVIFLSDNGGPEQDNASDNGLLRGGKGTFFEGGVRVPFAMQWPAYIKPGSRYEEMISSLDIFATIAAHVQGQRALANPLDGTDLLPYVTGKKSGSPHEFLFWRNYDQKRFLVVHRSGMKEITQNDSLVNRFDLKKDLSEQQELANPLDYQIGKFDRERKKWQEQLMPPAIWGLYQDAQYKPFTRPR